ncbi:hypothetical protein J2X36_002163 [Methylobacterium sp. BE186]|nr:hypothetical protein [Methylobacterium sp. BE186]
MPRRPATVTQADVARIIRAAKAAGLPVVRIVARPDGISVETASEQTRPERYDERLADEERVVVL